MRRLVRATPFMGSAALVVLVGPGLRAGAAAAEVRAPDGAFAPDANAAKEGVLLNQDARISGRIDILDRRADVLIQPRGREWEGYHETWLQPLGVLVILGTLLLLGLFYAAMGPLRLTRGRSGRTVTRFSPGERFAHWLAAISFVLLALTGLNVTYGKIVLRPVIGPDAFSAFAQWVKYTHNYAGIAFALGLLTIAALWLRQNLPTRLDLAWLRAGGGYLSETHVSAGRFNAGEKLVFWFAVLAGVAITASGVVLLFPFYGTTIAGMQLAHIVHSLTAIAFVAVILGHIYVGTIGTEGAIEAMVSGEVDVNWAREHHDLWLAETMAGSAPNERPEPASLGRQGA
ncbi:formate dehydrogenase subunit gamma [Salinarimonas soli]|uniref:Formate dehydrogenase subunit gamma n=1 Tax=Salinarimonas soli TaxID=1638099 RepID=A0A5B2VCU1_9HYPH|nr:formate dehydrogenase subunit gamma [Salinarimonas soli]KAA2236578.1 formate dehydrogenase subunit gamma [Salinarimonas soli]